MKHVNFSDLESKERKTSFRCNTVNLILKLKYKKVPDRVAFYAQGQVPFKFIYKLYIHS